MNIIQRYYLKEFLRLYLVIVAGLGTASCLIEIVSKVDDFMPRGASVIDLLFYSVLNVPRYILYLMPIAALMSSLFVISQAGRKKETIAIKAAGGSIRVVLMPLIYLGLLLSLVSLLIGESVAPAFSKKANKMKAAFAQKKRDIYMFREGAAWLRSGNNIIRIGLYLPDRGVIRGITIIRLDDDMLAERIEADSAEWRTEKGIQMPGSAAGSRGAWHLMNVKTYDMKTGVAIRYREFKTDIIAVPEILGEDMQGPEEMNVRELFAYTKKLRDSGIKNTKLVVDTHSRLSYPLINIIMLVFGMSLAGMGSVRGGYVTAAVGVAISLLYWLGYIALLSLGYTGVLPPVIAPWVVPAVFGGAAVYLFTRIPE